MNFSTKGMKFPEREESYKKGNIVPIGTVCFKAGDWCISTKEIIVDSSNQKKL